MYTLKILQWYSWCYGKQLILLRTFWKVDCCRRFGSYDNYFIFRQDGALAYRSRQAV